MKKIGMFVSAALLVLFVTSVTAKESSTINNFTEVQSKVEKLSKKYDPAKVLVVFDIDCTLVTQSEHFGSDVWWDWQSSLLKNNPDSPYLVSKDISEIIFYQGIIQNFTGSYLTEETILPALNQFAKEGNKMLVLTARGPASLLLIEKVFASLGLDFSKTAPAPSVGGQYAPYDLNNPENAGLTSSEISEFNLKTPRKVRYDAGVFFSAGQNKGIMLKTFLHKVGKSFDAIVFVDDAQNNVDDVWNVYKDSNIDINTYRYSFDDSMKRQFRMSDKHNVIKQWKEFKDSIDSIYGKPLDPKDNY